MNSTTAFGKKDINVSFGIEKQISTLLLLLKVGQKET